MPVDRQLAIESLKRLDDGLYNMYRRIQDVEDYVRKDPVSFRRAQPKSGHSLFSSATEKFSVDRQGSET